jgi:hypothetical protein
VGRANAGTGPRPVLCQRAVSLPRARAGPTRPWAACAVYTGRADAVDVGRALLYNWAERGFGPVTVELVFYFPNIFKFLQIKKFV